MMWQMGLVAVGGAIGSVGRFWLAVAVARWLGAAFPYGTMLINILGSGVIGWLAGLIAYGRVAQADALRAFAMAGLCGGFTTFSAFSLQTLELMREGRMVAAAANVAVSVVVCLGATMLGFWLSRGEGSVLF